MRILVVSDLHYRLPHFDWLVETSPHADAVVIAGDLADVVTLVPHDVQTVVIAKYLQRIAQQSTLLVASGNHDLDGPGWHGEQMATWLRRIGQSGLHVDGASVDVGDTRFTVCPWWDGPITRDEVGVQLAQAARGRPEHWMWIYHAPPAGTPLCHDGTRTFPDRELAEWIGQHQPDMVFCGHIHQSPWAADGSWHARIGETRVFNAGKQIGRVPSHIKLDTEAGTAEWFGITDRDSLVLARAGATPAPQ